jgi:hypothetical protein
MSSCGCLWTELHTFERSLRASALVLGRRLMLERRGVGRRSEGGSEPVNEAAIRLQNLYRVCILHRCIIMLWPNP